MLPVIVQHRVIERVDALEIFGIERVLGADAMAGLGAEIGLQQLRAPAPESTGRARSDRGRSFPAARPDRPRAGCRARSRVLPRSRPARGQAASVYAPADRHAPPASPWCIARSRPRHRGQRLAGRIRNEMQMEVAVAAALRHEVKLMRSNLCAAGEEATPSAGVQGRAGNQACFFPHRCRWDGINSTRCGSMVKCELPVSSLARPRGFNADSTPKASDAKRAAVTKRAGQRISSGCV